MHLPDYKEARSRQHRDYNRIDFDIKEEVIKYYDATGIKHFYLDVEDMSDDELIELYENSFAKEE